MNSSSTASIRVGVITDVTGPLSLLGVANANIAKMGIARAVNLVGPFIMSFQGKP
jgi:hypothetical protein